MKETIEITAAFDALLQEGKTAALATVIAIEGSAYRRPGARMLIAEDGRTWGGVSGGCLERDVARRGREVINSQNPQRCRYDSTDEQSLSDGASTGCGGAIEIFVQPVNPSDAGPMRFFREVVQARRAQTIATIVRSGGMCGKYLPGTSVLFSEFAGWNIVQSTTTPSVQRSPVWVDSSYGVVESRRLGDQSVDLFVERLLPPQAIVLVGAGPDARAVATLAKLLGWHVTVVAARPATSVHERFATVVDQIEITGADEPLYGVAVATDAAVVLMTHNVNRDRLALAALPRELAYLGLLGPRHRTERILEEIGRSCRTSLASPVGLDIGAETPEEIALAIVAEIQASLRGASGRPLSQLLRPIHATTRPATAIDDWQFIPATSCKI